MKRTSAPADFAEMKRESFVELEAIRDLAARIEERNKLEEHALAIPAKISEAQIELEEIGVKILDTELAVLQVSEKRLPEAMQQREALEEKQVECALRIRRLQTQLSAIEARAPEIDAKIELALGFVRIEASMAAETIQAELADEMRGAAKALQLVYAKVRALQRMVPMLRTRDFLSDAYVPDLESCMSITNGNGSNTTNLAPNLINVVDTDTDVAEASIEDQLKPISEALIAGRRHKPYVPLAKRPAPYVIKGSNEGPGFGRGGAIGPASPPIPADESPSPFKGYRTDQPYEIRGDQSGIRTRQAAAEMNMTAAIAAQAESAERQ